LLGQGKIKTTENLPEGAPAAARGTGKGKRKEGLVGKACMAVDIPDHAGREGSTPGQRPASGSEREKTSGQSSGSGLFERVFVLPKYTVGRCSV